VAACGSIESSNNGSNMTEAVEKETPETEGKEEAKRPDPGNIHEALLEVYRKVGYVQKTGVNQAQKYKYAGEPDLIAAIRPAMIEAGIISYCSGIRNITHTEIRKTVNKKERVSFNLVAEYEYTFCHTPSLTEIKVYELGEGADSLDKACYKAATGSMKYALRQTFLIETGNDPDEPGEEEGKKPKADSKPPKPDNRTLTQKKADDRTKWLEWANKYVATLAGFTTLSQLQELLKDPKKNEQLKTLAELYPDILKNIETARIANNIRLGGQPLAEPVNEEGLGY
jgi:hypothetical protein